MSKKIKLLFSIIISVSVLTFFLYTQFSKAQTGSLRVYFFDVGQGDSIFIKTPEGKDILIDGGPDKKVLENLAAALPFWDRYIDLMILTHPHADHINGLTDVLDRYSIGKVLEADLSSEPESMIYFNKKTDKEENILAGSKLVIEEGLELDFLYPFNLDLEEKDLNDTSLVFLLAYRGKKFLFTGDAGTEVEAKILDQDIESDFLKVGHHGSRYSSSEQFLEKVSPLISIISVGEDNSYGHPTKDTLDRLSNVGSRVLRTDNNGTIEVDVGGDGEWVINCSKGCN